MKVLFITRDLIAGNLAYLMKKEGCEVKMFIQDKQHKKNFENLVNKTNNWKKELNWVGKKGLIIFDDIGFGKIQDKLRKKGYSVFGGTELGDKLEADREWAQKIFKEYGIKTLPTFNFNSINETLRYLMKNKGPWVLKQNGHAAKIVNFVSNYSDNRDIISLLNNYKINYGNNLGIITLQKKVYGIEVGVGRYFNGKDWVGPIEINLEHKKLFPGDLGPTTSEMGTVAWYTSENNILFKKSLEKIKPFLSKIEYKGNIDIGCIVNKKGIYPLEATARMGSPIVHLHSELHHSPWSKFLKAIAKGRNFNLKWKRGIGIVILIALPPFPYLKKLKNNSSFGLEINFHNSLIKKGLEHVHFEEVSLCNKNTINSRYYVSDHRGYILYVTAVSRTISGARKKASKILKQISIPKMFYRNDIGINFEKRDYKQLVKWGYLKKISKNNQK